MVRIPSTQNMRTRSRSLDAAAAIIHDAPAGSSRSTHNQPILFLQPIAQMFYARKATDSVVSCSE